MKKVLSGLILATLLTVPLIGLAQPIEDPPEDLVTSEEEIWDLVDTAARWVFRFVMFVAVIFFCLSAFYFMTASGDPEKASKAKSMAVYALIGTAVALLAWSLPLLIQAILGG